MTFNFVSYDQMVNDCITLATRIPWNQVCCVAGIPRSGSMVASILALHAHKPISIVTISSRETDILPQESIGRGPKHAPHAQDKILLVDDSVYTGKTMQRVVDNFPDPGKLLTACLYYSDKQHTDYAVTKVTMPRGFEWNLFNGVHMKTAMLDIDGVLCVDPPVSISGPEGDRYAQFISSALPLYVPHKFSVHSLITNRLEKWRQGTQDWCHSHGVAFRNLYMADYDTPQERRKMHAYGNWKGKTYRQETGCNLFIESDAVQAQQVKAVSGKPVLCIQSKKVL